MSYISAYHDRYAGQILVWEKNKEGHRVCRKIDNSYYFYVPDRLGDYESITGVRLKKISCTGSNDFDQAVLASPYRFESDIDPLERALQDNYSKLGAPKLSVGFVDIEVDYDEAIGFAGPQNPYAVINALTLYNVDEKRYYTYAIPPKSWKGERVWQTPEGGMSELPAHLQYVRLFTNEKDLLTAFLEDLHKIDVLSGWNSEFYDIPYIGKRIELIFGAHALSMLAFEGGPKPRWTEKPRFKHSKNMDLVLDLQSRVHLDYLLLVRKFNLTTRQSFALNSVAKDELGEEKLHYDGSLSELYNNDFIKFLEYNKHDVTLLIRLDQKFKYIELANQMVHEATVNFKAIFGSVALIDGAVINFAHNRLNKIVFDKQIRPEGPPVEGALVVTPIPGLYDWIGSCDINSLYPSTIRSLNLSPEKIVGQIKEHEAGWRAFYAARKNPDDQAKQLVELTVTLDGSDEEMPIYVGELIALCNEKKWVVSGFGTILDQSSGDGVVPAILTYWFKGRKEMQAEKKKWAKEKAKHPKGSPEYLEAEANEERFDLLQGVRKVLLNSTYGALLNEFMRFGDPRLGASTTYSGRQITSFMADTITAEMRPGEANPPRLVKTVTHVTKNKRDGSTETKVENTYLMELNGGPGVIYGDTDSSYFTMNGLVESEEEAIMLADALTQRVNDLFPSFMREAFGCQPGNDDLIKANREYVCRTGILQAKKKYMMLAIDKEGKRIQPGDDDELKTMGSDIRLSSTPAMIKELLTNVVMAVLKKQPKNVADEIILAFRKELNKGELKVNPLDLSAVVSIKELEEHQFKWEHIEKVGRGKVALPSNARATINHNWMVEKLDLKDWTPIKSGEKIKILWLKAGNEYGFETMAFSSDVEELPKWFTDRFEVDMAAMELKLVDQKVKLIFDALGWEVPTFQDQLVKTLLSFDD